MPEHPGPPTLSLALHSVVDAAVDASTRAGLLAIVRPDGGPQVAGERIVVPFPSQRRSPEDDGPDAA